MNMPKILFVCTGNTCRSPMAEAIWRAMGGQAESCGISAWTGLSATEAAARAVTRWGANLAEHRARDLHDVGEEPDWVLVMTRAQRDAVVRDKPQWQGKTFLLTEFVGESGDIRDPLGADQENYQSVADEIHRLLEKLQERLDGQGRSHSAKGD